MALANVLFITIGTALAWWLSGHDHRVTGENPKRDFIRRAIRTGVTFVLICLATLNGFVAIFIFAALGFYWASCGAEFFSGQFHKLLDPEDKRPFDPKAADRMLDQLALLVREGRASEALDMCSHLEKSGDASALALEATVHRLYQEQLNAAETSPVLAEIWCVCERKQFELAEARLKQMIATQPKNWAAMLLLMRVYAEGLSQPQKALALIQPADKQPKLHPAFDKYARQSIKEWSAPVKVQPTDSNGASSGSLNAASKEVVTEVSIEELLKTNQLATAVELLEQATVEEPKNFDVWVKLAEVYGVNCRDLNRAARIVQKMEFSASFTPQEMGLAKAKLKEWREGRRS